MLDAIKTHQPALIFIAYPNNPTGNLFDEQAIIEIIQATQGLVVIDEAYHPFACTSFMCRTVEFDNLLVMRTVSKMGLAGLRLGLLVGAKKWINEFNKVRLPYNINILTQVSGVFAIQHADVFEQQASSIREQREWMFNVLNTMDDLEVYPSQANFILFRLKKAKAEQVFNGLKDEGILIKNMNPAGGMLQQCLRVTIGMPEENKIFIYSLKKII